MRAANGSTSSAPQLPAHHRWQCALSIGAQAAEKRAHFLEPMLILLDGFLDTVERVFLGRLETHPPRHLARLKTRRPRFFASRPLRTAKRAGAWQRGALISVV
jgi:hypothetical protein